MGSTKSNLKHKFTVSAVDKYWNTDTFINIIKRRENIIYSSSVPAAAANIAYISSKDVNSATNLSILDRSSSLQANRIIKDNINTISDSYFFSSDTDEILITDIFTEENNTISVTPLFFKHVISTDNVSRDSDNSIQSGITLKEVLILDQNLDEVETYEKYIDYDNGIVYNNLESNFVSNNDFTVYYIKYTIVENGASKTFIDILDNQQVYSIAEFSDLDEDLNIIEEHKVYLIEETIDGYDITLPSVGDYAYKTIPESRIQLKHNQSVSISDPWYVDISNGKFITTVNGTLYKYHIAEFETQLFYPTYPTKQVNNEESTVLNQNLIKLDNSGIYQSSTDNLYINVLINKSDGTGLAALTTDSSLVGTTASNNQTYIKWTYTNKTGIRSIDNKTGILDIEGIKLKDSYTIISNYYYIESNYEYTLIDFNPVNNTENLTRTVSLFVYPDSPSTSRTQTIYYLIHDETGKVIQSNWNDFDNDTGKLNNGELLFYEKIPDFLQTTTPGESDYIPSTTEIFIDDYSTEGDGIFLVLGDIVISEASTSNKISSIDTRVRGGGIVEDHVETIAEKYPESNWFWDQGEWDGQPYPGTASYLVEVPIELLQGAGGSFTTKQVRDIVERHTAFGVYPITKGYGIDIEFEDVKISNGSTTLYWTGYNTPTSGVYNVYQSTYEKGPWELVNTNPISHISSGNSYTISGLSKGIDYYFIIAGGIISDSNFVPYISQSFNPNNTEVLGPANPPITPVKIRKYEIYKSTSTIFGHKFEVT